MALFVTGRGVIAGGGDDKFDNGVGWGERNEPPTNGLSGVKDKDLTPCVRIKLQLGKTGNRLMMTVFAGMAIRLLVG